MWRQIGKLISKLAIVLLPVVLLLQTFCAALPMVYMDGEYAMYKQQKDYLSSDEYNRVLIIGDSRTKAGFIPDELGSDVYNVALGGISPVESYYMLCEYLQHHDAPEYLVMAYAPVHLCQADPEADDFVLWNRCVYFHTFNQKDLFDLKKHAKDFENTEIIDKDAFLLEYAMYKTYFPNKYGTALKKALFENRYKANKDKYAQMEVQKGYSLFGIDGPNGGVNAEAKRADFMAADLIDDYYNRIFELCRENNIQVIVEQLPMTETSFNILTPEFRANYSEYMHGLSTKNPDVWMNTDLICFQDAWFGDIDHLNTDGAKLYCNTIKTRYPQVFIEQ